MTNLSKLFVKVIGSVDLNTIKTVSQETSNVGKIYFLEEAGQLVVNGKVYGSDSAEYAALVAAVGKKAEGENAATGLFADVEANSAAITTLNGDANTAGSVAAAIAALKKEIMTGEATGTVAEAYDTLKEIADWISANDSAEDAAGLTHDVASLKQSIGEKAVAASEGVEAKPATGLYKEIEDAKAANTSAIEALDVTDAAVAGKYVSSVSQEDGKITVIRADLPTLSVKTGSDNYVGVNGHEVEIKTSELGSVGLTKATEGDNAGKWVAGTSNTATGLATAADVAAEIVADEEVIATALNDHETRISAAETAIGKAATGDGTGENAATGLYKEIADAVSAVQHTKTTVGDGSTAGKLKVDGTDVTITTFDAAGTAQAKIEELDKAETTASADGAHVTVKYSETNGIVSMTVTESDIASASALSTLSGGAASTVKAAEDRLDALEAWDMWETYTPTQD